MSERSQYGYPEPPTDEEVIAQQRAGARRTAVILLLLVLLIGGVTFYYLSKWRTSLDAIGRDESINVLLLGVTDRATDETLDAVIVASFHPATKAVDAVALPASTVWPRVAAVVGSPGVAAPASSAGLEASDSTSTLPQLRDVYAQGAAAELTATLESLLGAPIHHTVRLDYSGFVELVDLLGGVSVDVLSDIVYRDAEGDVVFHLEPGTHLLSGEEALLYVRYKGGESEAERLERQRRFVEQVVAETRRQLGWEKIQPLIRIGLNHVATDLDVAAATRLAGVVFDSERVSYSLHMLPGTDEEEGWVVDAARTASLSGQMFHNPSWSDAP